MFAAAPCVIDAAPYESTMGLVQKIFYFHLPSRCVMFTAALVCGVASALYLFAAQPSADRVAVAAAELAVVFGLIVLVTGPLWARKAWGVWWDWDARLTIALMMWLILRRLPAAAPVRRPRLGGARARPSALRHGARAVRLLVGEPLADAASRRRPWCRRCRPGCAGRALVVPRRVHAARTRRCSASRMRLESGAGRSSTSLLRWRTDDEASACGDHARGRCSAAGVTSLLAAQPPPAQDDFVPVSDGRARETASGGAARLTAYAFVWVVLLSVSVVALAPARPRRARARRAARAPRETLAARSTHAAGALHLHPGGAAGRHRDRLDPRLARRERRLRGRAQTREEREAGEQRSSASEPPGGSPRR